MIRLLRLPLLALIFSVLVVAGCDKQAEQSSSDKAPLPVPTSQDDADWRQYISQMIGRHVKVKRGVPPFAVYISPDEDPAATIDNAN